MKVTTLDLGAPGGELLASAAYLAVLAYPDSHQKRDQVVSAILAFANRGAKNLKKPLSPIASELFREVESRRQGEILGTGQKGALPRIYRRLAAAEAASKIISTNCSLNDVATNYEGNPSYFLHTIWSESKTVLHLALALRGVLMRWDTDGRPIYLQLLARLGWVREAILHAENWRLLIISAAKAEGGPPFTQKIDPKKFIRLVLADCADSPTTIWRA